MTITNCATRISLATIDRAFYWQRNTLQKKNSKSQSGLINKGMLHTKTPMIRTGMDPAERRLGRKIEQAVMRVRRKVKQI